jgi:diguanylate cyclase (GGDEF)-like protein
MRVLSVDGRPAAKARDFLAVRLGIAQYAASAALVIFVVLLSGAGRQHLTAALVTAAVASAYAAFQAFVPASPRLLPLFAFGSGLFVVNTSVAIAATGGSHSPLRVLLIFSVVYAAWYYERRPAAAIMASVMVADLLPLAYDRRGVHPEELGLTVALGVVLVLAGWLMLVGRRETDRLRERARREARRDPLTDLANRRALIRDLEKRVASRRDEDRFGVVFLDLDGFKDLNTAFGHAAGDAALKVVAQALRECTREADLVSRVAGDEFVIVAPGVAADELREVAQRAVDAIAAAPLAGLAPEGHAVALAASAGTALWPEDATDADDVLRAADLAMLAAKRTGKGRVVAAAEDRQAASLASQP